MENISGRERQLRRTLTFFVSSLDISQNTIKIRLNLFYINVGSINQKKDQEKEKIVISFWKGHALCSRRS